MFYQLFGILTTNKNYFYIYFNMNSTNPVTTNCLSCGNPVNTSYCSACGEKVLVEHEKSVAHFLGEALHNVTHADGKFLRSLRILIFSPGTLSLNYLEGKRKRFMNPLSMFVFANLLYLLFSPVDALNSNYHSQQAQPYYGEMTTRKFEEKMKTKGWTEEQMSEHYDAKSGKLAKLLLILLVLFLSVPLALVYFSRKRYYVDHLIFATEITNFIILVILLLLPWLFFLIFYALRHGFGMSTAGFDINGDLSLGILGLGLLTYLSLASHKLYRANWWLAVAKSFAVLIGLFFCVLFYRFVLFMATMAML